MDFFSFIINDYTITSNRYDELIIFHNYNKYKIKYWCDINTETFYKIKTMKDKIMVLNNIDELIIIIKNENENIILNCSILEINCINTIEFDEYTLKIVSSDEINVNIAYNFFVETLEFTFPINQEEYKYSGDVNIFSNIIKNINITDEIRNLSVYSSSLLTLELNDCIIDSISIFGENIEKINGVNKELKHLNINGTNTELEDNYIWMDKDWCNFRKKQSKIKDKGNLESIIPNIKDYKNLTSIRCPEYHLNNTILENLYLLEIYNIDDNVKSFPELSSLYIHEKISNVNVIKLYIDKEIEREIDILNEYNKVNNEEKYILFKKCYHLFEDINKRYKDINLKCNNIFKSRGSFDVRYLYSRNVIQLINVINTFRNKDPEIKIPINLGYKEYIEFIINYLYNNKFHHSSNLNLDKCALLMSMKSDDY